MGTDYLSRKKAKKFRKGLDESSTKQTKKQKKRLCRGVCYMEAPQLLDHDKEGSSTRRRKRTMIEEERPSNAAPKKRVKAGLSTSVKMLDAKTSKKETVRHTINLEELDASIRSLFPDQIQRFMAMEGYKTPTAIQSACWPLLLNSKDVVALAPPGQGKTLGYVLPAAAALIAGGHSAASNPPSPLVLVLLPTRELAQQVSRVFNSLRRYTGLRGLCVTGGGVGAEVHRQALQEKAPHVLIATPGRLLDLMEHHAVHLDKVEYVVIDEADKMLDMGFQPQLEQVHEEVSKGAVRPLTCLFSATMPQSLELSASAWLHHPETVQIASSGEELSRSVTQVVHVCAEHKKPKKLSKHLMTIKESSAGLRAPPKVIIFANRIKTVQYVHKFVKGLQLRVEVLHGERSQEERDEALQSFRSGKAQILVSTDVAARGLHVAGLAYVINYDFPGSLETYIHRVGRTGRLKSDGHAYTFLTRSAAPMAGPLIDLLQKNGQEIDPNLMKLAQAYAIAKEKLGGVDSERPPPAEQEVVRHQQLPQPLESDRGTTRKVTVPEGEEEEEEEGSSSSQGDAAAPLCRLKSIVLPGKLWKVAPIEATEECGMNGEIGQVTARKQRPKALPGRLRKKLATSQ